MWGSLRATATRRNEDGDGGGDGQQQPTTSNHNGRSFFTPQQGGATPQSAPPTTTTKAPSTNLISPSPLSITDRTPTKANTRSSTSSSSTIHNNKNMITPLHLPTPYTANTARTVPSTTSKNNHHNTAIIGPSTSWDISLDEFRNNSHTNNHDFTRHPNDANHLLPKISTAVTPTPPKEMRHKQQQQPPQQHPKRPLHLSHRRRCLHHIRPLRQDEQQQQPQPQPHDDLMLHGIPRGTGVVLDLTSMFVDPPPVNPHQPQHQQRSHKTQVPPSPTETATTSLSTTLLFVTTSNNSPLRPPSPMTVASSSAHGSLVPASPVQQTSRTRMMMEDQQTMSTNNTKRRQEQLEECQVLTHWLNFVLVQEDSTTNTKPTATTTASTKSHPVSWSWKHALHYHYQWSKAQRQAQQLWQSSDMIQLQTRIATQVQRQKVQLRPDRDPCVAGVARDRLLQLLWTSYAPCWLQLGLETVFGSHTSHNQPIRTRPQQRLYLQHMLTRRVLSDEALLQKYNQGRGARMPSGAFGEAYRSELRQVVLQRLLSLVLFLDRAACSQENLPVPDTHNHLLFRQPKPKDDEEDVVRSTRDLLVIFCREFLSKEGDIIKHLSRVGLPVFYRQDPLDELTFRVSNFAVDLRDGMRLTRLTELLLLVLQQQSSSAAEQQDPQEQLAMYSKASSFDMSFSSVTSSPRRAVTPRIGLSRSLSATSQHQQQLRQSKYPLLSQLRLPAVSRLQKIHNVNVALKALQEEYGLQLPAGLAAHHVVDGNRSMVLKLMWTIVMMHCFGGRKSNAKSNDTESTAHDEIFRAGNVPEEHAMFRGHLSSPDQVQQEILAIEQVKRERSRKRSQHRHRGVLNLLQQEGDAITDVSEEGLDPDSDESTVTAQPQQQTPAQEQDVPWCPSSSFDLDLDDGMSTTSALAGNAETKALALPWKTVLIKWCQTVCSLFDHEDCDVAPEKFSSEGALLSDLLFSKVLCYLIHFYHPSMLSLQELRRLNTVSASGDAMAEQEARVRSAKQPIAEGRQIDHWHQRRSNPVVYMRAAFRCISELGGIPNMLRTTLHSSSVVHDAPAKMISAPPDEKSLVVYLYYLCSRLLESRHEFQACKRIQIGYRYHRFHTLFSNKRKAARVILHAWRSHLQQYYENRRYKYILSVQIIEEFMICYRSGLENLKAARLQRELEQLAASTIQAGARMFFAIVRYRVMKERHYSAMLLQCHYRRHRAQLAYKELRLRLLPPILLLQRHWRGYAARSAFLTKIDSAIHLQAFARSAVLVRCVLIPSWHYGATSMQRIWRGFWVQLQYQMTLLDIVAVQCIARRGAAIGLSKRRSAAWIKLQYAGRRFLAVKKLYLLRRQKAAAIIIQNLGRRHLARREAAKRRAFIAFAHAIFVVQRSWRHVRWTRVRKSAATRLQAHYRSRIAQRKYSAMLSSALCLQTKFRQHHATKIYTRVRRNVVLIQSIIRRWYYGVVVASERRRARETIRSAARLWITLRAIQRSKARRRLQNVARRWLARNHLLALREERRILIEKVTLCQSLCRRHLRMKEVSNSKNAAKFLQCWWRFRRWTRHVGRKLVLMQALGRCGYFAGKAETFQLSPSHVRIRLSKIRSVRKGLSSKKQRVDSFHSHQRICPHLRMRSQCIALRSKRFNALKLQSLQIPRLPVLARLNQTSLILQASWLHGLRPVSTASAVDIARRSLGGRHAAKQLNRRRRMVKNMQVLSKTIDLNRYEYLARRLKSDVRGLHLTSHRKQLLTHRLECISKRTISQPNKNTLRMKGSNTRAVKSHLFRWSATDPSQSKITILQAYARGFVARRANEKRGKSAVAIQRCWRRFYSAILKVQAFWRRCSICIQLGYKHDAATNIQRAWRGHVATEEFRVHCACVIVAQSLARRVIAHNTVMKRRRALALLQRNAPCWVAVCRLSQLKRERDLRLEHYVGPSVQIQAIVRGYLARSELMSHRAARIIQAQWRCYANETKYILMGLSVISVQSYCRCLSLKRSYQRSRRGAVLLQAQWRGVRGRRLLSRRHECAIVLQSNLRMLARRAGYCRELEACRTVQRYVRGFSVRLPVILQIRAARKIQKTWRSYDANAHFIIAVISAVKIQSVMRMRLGKQRADSRRRQKMRKYLDRYCTIIQVSTRKFLSRKAARRWIRKIVETQRLMRGYLVRRSVEAFVKASALRIKKAGERAAKEPDLRLGVRMARALALLKTSRNLAEIMTVVCTIELATRFSKTCCEVFVKANATEALISLIGTCNRSLPHVELLYYILRCLSNVARFGALRGDVATLHMANSLMYLIHMYRDEEAIFCNAIALLNKCAHFSAEFKEFCRSDACMKRLSAVHVHWAKKLRKSSCPSRNVLEPQFVAKSNSKTGMMILGISYDLNGGVATLDRLIAELNGEVNMMVNLNVLN